MEICRDAVAVTVAATAVAISHTIGNCLGSDSQELENQLNHKFMNSTFFYR